MSESIPKAFNDFVFDLHQASRVALRNDEVTVAYEQHKEVTEKFFSQSSWPDASRISQDCDNDEVFLALYREIALRHKTVREYKPNTHEIVEAWALYSKLFEFILASNDLALSVQWIADILQEFVYQFQGCCQHRISARTAELSGVWSFDAVTTILNSLIAQGAEAVSDDHPLATKYFLATFAKVELARVFTIVTQFPLALETLSSSVFTTASALLSRVPVAYSSAFFHTGVSQLVLGQYSNAIESFSKALLNKTATRSAGPQSQLQKTHDKCLALLAIATALFPRSRVDEQVKDQIDAKFSDKIRRIKNGEGSTLADLFESACPKFVSASTTEAVFAQVVSAFVAEAKLAVKSVKVLHYLQLYSVIEVAKLAALVGCSETDLQAQLQLIKSNFTVGKTAADDSTPVAQRILDLNDQWANSTSVNFTLEGSRIVTSTCSAKVTRRATTQAVFVSGLKKHVDINSDIDRIFGSVGL